MSISLLERTRVVSIRERESSSTTEGGPDTRQANEEHHIARGIEQLRVCSYAVLRLTFEDHLRKLEAAWVGLKKHLFSVIEAASLIQLEAVLLDAASLSQLEAASLSLEESHSQIEQELALSPLC